MTPEQRLELKIAANFARMEKGHPEWQRLLPQGIIIAADKELDALTRERDDARAEVERLREALRPFAEDFTIIGVEDWVNAKKVFYGE